eukprot:g26006.t1
MEAKVTKTLEQFVSFVNRTGNADNTFRLVVGINMLVRAHVRDKVLQQSLTHASNAMNECRHTLRLLGLLKQIVALANQRRPEHNSQGLLTLAKTLAMMVFFTYDSLGWAKDFGVIDRERFDTGYTASRMWLLWIVLDSVSILLSLQSKGLSRAQATGLVHNLTINCIDFPQALAGSFDFKEPLLSPTRDAMLNIAAAALCIQRDWPRD